MHDTTPEVARYVRDRLQALSGAERLVMGAAMFETARTLVLASFPADLPEEEVRRRLCERFYGALAERVYPRTGIDG